ncbi:hypothetical protein LJE86_18060 [bacterium BMS3Abin03]|nr:hypothetical protein [bacterium BMS3Abin03]
MKQIIFSMLFLLLATSIKAQYKMSIDKADGTIQDVWIHDINEITFTEVEFTCGTSTITYAGQTYNTVQIGDQCWFKENLNIGDRITGSSDQTDNSTIEKYCYNDLEENCDNYGGLYQWDEVMQYTTTAGTKGICPQGWHIPTSSEFNPLRQQVGDNGNSLKAIGQGSGGGAGTNTSGFSALLAGIREYDGTFASFGIFTAFWSSSQSGASAYYMSLYDDKSTINVNTTTKLRGFGIRCLKDD